MIEPITKLYLNKYSLLDAPAAVYTVRTIADLKPERKKVEGFIENSDMFRSPEYNFAENGKAADVESLVKRSIELKHTLMFKEGYVLVGSNADRVDYIRERFRQLGVAQQQPMDLLIRELARSFFRNSNAFALKVRNAKNSGGKVRKANGKDIQPISALFEIPSETICYKKKNNQVVAWGQDPRTLDGSDQVLWSTYTVSNRDSGVWGPGDVLHFYRSRKAGFVLGTPDLVPILDDIRALRRIEQNVELLIYQHIYPLYHYRIGTDGMPARENKGTDGYDEIERAKVKIEDIPPEGMFITSHRHEIRAIGAEGKALEVQEYLQYFLKRVIIGLGISEVDLGLGDSANRSTAENISKNLVDLVKGVQREFEIFMNENFIYELLLEGGFSDPLSKDNIVHFRFNEIDIDKKIKLENHEMTLYQGGLTTQDEARVQLGRDVLNERQQKETFVYLVEIPKLKVKLETNVNKTEGASKMATSRAKPRNQHTDFMDSATDSVISELVKELKDMSNYSSSKDWKRIIIEMAASNLADIYHENVLLTFKNNLRHHDLKKSEVQSMIGIAQKEMDKIVLSSLEYFATKLRKKLETNTLIDSIDSLDYMIKFLNNTVPAQTKNYTVVLDQRLLGKDYVKIVASDGCQTCLDYKDKLLYIKNGVSVTDIPPWHFNCKCEITPVG